MNRLSEILLVFAVLACAGCVPLDDGFVGGTDLTGNVEGIEFDYASGSAEQTETGYVVSLTNSTAFSCNSVEAPPQDYVLISLTNIETAPATFDAAGNVYFNSFQDGVSAGSAATSGTVTIDEISTFDGALRGTVDASNATSEIFGSFDVELCF